jgi:RNA polymerase sigma factor (sigma-70 family)
MTKPNPAPVTGYLRRLLGPPCAHGLSDAQLVERFVQKRDESAFEALVGRHGPTILGVCRRVLRHDQDAEDAFQATFLVLVRKAGSIGRRQALASWLYRVAYRVALRIRIQAASRTARQKPLTDVSAAVVTPSAAWSDLRPVIDEEVNRLPEKYRAPFVLCYLGGKTNEQAARELGCPKGTVLSRLAWARQRLRARLIRRGLALSAGLTPSSLMPDPAFGEVPANLVNGVQMAARYHPAGLPAAGIVSVRAAALATGVLQTMLWNKMKLVATCVAAALALAGGGGMVAWQICGSASTASQPRSSRSAKAENSSSPTPARPAEEKKFSFEMRDQPWPKVFQWLSDQTGQPVIMLSKPRGTFTFMGPAKRTYTLGEIIDVMNEALLKQKVLLIRRTASFNLWPADEKVDPALVPTVRPGNLAGRGKTELVSMVLRLRSLVAEDVRPEVKKLLGPFGTVTGVQAGNLLVVQDMAGNLRRVLRTIRGIDAKPLLRPKGNRPKAREKTYPFEVRDKPWAEVLKWYADISGTPFVGSDRPRGRVHFIAPQGNRRYTLGEIIDILNELLVPQKVFLHRNEASFTLLSADEMRMQIGRNKLDDLRRRGQTELVQVTLPLNRLKAEEIGPDFKKLLGPNGWLVSLTTSNRLLVQDLAGNVRRIRDLIQEIEDHLAEKDRRGQRD